MRWLSWIVVGIVALAACQHASPAPPAAVAATAPARGAAGDADLRVMLSELASSKACGMVRDGFQGLRSPDHPELVTGVLWIRHCEITNVGAHVTFHIDGNGWLWVDQTKSKAGGAFTVRQYVRFSIATTIRGAIDISYHRDLHVATLWFTPDRTPQVAFKTVGDIEVDPAGVWSSVVGTIGAVFSDSPADLAQIQATTQGTHDLSAKLAHGFGVTVNLCTGLRRISIGQPPSGEMAIADIGETRRVPAEIQPGGVMIVGPQDASDGMTLRADVARGGVRLTLVCTKYAEAIAAEYLAGGVTSNVPVLGAIEVRTQARLQIKPTPCPVVVVATPLDEAPTRFAWERPTAEIARSTGGPLVQCAKPKR